MRRNLQFVVDVGALLDTGVRLMLLALGCLCRKHAGCWKIVAATAVATE